MMTPKEMIEVIAAHELGADIEIRAHGVGGGEWVRTAFPLWNFNDFDYRVMQAPKPDVVLDYVADHTTTNVYLLSVDAKIRANLRLTYDGETGKLKYAEVLK